MTLSRTIFLKISLTLPAQNIARETRLHTDETTLYVKVGAEFATHETVNHSRKEYARGDVTTKSVKGHFSIFIGGMKGVYQHCAEKHLHRYLSEDDFRFNHRVSSASTMENMRTSPSRVRLASV